MKKVIKTVNKIEAPLESVWSLIRTGENVNTWLPIIVTCRVEGTNRYCTTKDGSLDESILRSDDQEKVFQYAIVRQDVFPVSDIVGTMTLSSVNETETNLNWDVEFDIADPTILPEIESAIRGIYAQGAQGLEVLANETVG